MLKGVCTTIQQRRYRLGKSLQTSQRRERTALHMASNGTSAGSNADGVVLISFDVDGTLIRSVGDQANYQHKAAFSAGFKRVFDVDSHIDIIKHHGGTDPLIVVKVLELNGIPKEEVMKKLKDVEAAMVEHFLNNQDTIANGLELLPGVKTLLEKLKATPGVATCLVTGNMEPIGWAKMKALGISEYFTEPNFGGFGSDFCSGNTEEMWKDRQEFVRIAAERCGKLFPDAGIKARFHVGDTPMDMQAAVGAGAVPVGVTTGIFSKEELLASVDGNHAVVFDSLRNTDEVLKAFGVDGAN